MRRIRNMVRGFTLVELLIVLAVIATLLAIITPYALGVIRQAQATQVASTLRNIRSLVEAYVTATKPTEEDNDVIQELVDLKYLTERPENYLCEFTVSNDTVTATITYVGGGDDLADLVAKILPGATKSSTNDNDIVYSFEIPRWW